MIEIEDRDGLRILRLAHGKVSAMDVELAGALAARLAAAAADPVRAVVLTGTGSAFSAGVDLHRVLEGGPAYGARLLQALDGMIRAALEFPKPLVAAVNGHAIAGGCILAAACDVRLMAEGKGRIGLPELALGVTFTGLLFSTVAQRLTDGALRQVIYGAKTVAAQEAVALGLADECCPADELMRRACDRAEALASLGREAFAITKGGFRAQVLARAAQAQAMDALTTQAWTQPSTYEAIRSYLDGLSARK